MKSRKQVDVPQDRIVYIRYTNWRNETAWRRITPTHIWFGSTEWHAEPQWLLAASDMDKQGASRDFALKDILEWRESPPELSQEEAKVCPECNGTRIVTLDDCDYCCPACIGVQRIIGCTKDDILIIEECRSTADSKPIPVEIPMNLFQSGNFTLNSGAKSSWKLECDTLTDADWHCLADMIRQMVGPFSSVEGVPRGGLKLAACLQPFVGSRGPHLVVDDVMTTGGSMNRVRDEHIKRLPPGTLIEPGNWLVGAVVFARGPLPPWIKAAFQLPPSLWLKEVGQQ